MARIVLGTDINNSGSSAIVRDLSPAMYREYEVNKNGVLVGSTNASKVMDLNGATDIGDYILYGAYVSNKNISSVDFSSLIKLTTQYSCQNTFNSCSNLTTVDLSNLKKITGNHACYSMFSYCTNLTDIDLSSLEYIGDNYCANSMFSVCSSLKNVDLSKLAFIGNSNNTSAVDSMFYRCTSLTSIDLSSLTVGTIAGMFNGCSKLEGDIVFSKLATITGYNSSYNQRFYNAFSGTKISSISFPALVLNTTNINNSTFDYMLSSCSNVTVHFPSNWETAMSSWSSVQSGFGGSNTTVLFDLPDATTIDLSTFNNEIPDQCFTTYSYRSFQNCTTIKNINFSNIESIGMSGFQGAFQGCTGIISVDLSKVKNLYYNALQYAFQDCTNLTSVDLSSLEILGYNSVLYGTFKGCTNLTSVDLSGLKHIYNRYDGSMVYYPCQSMFEGCTSLESITFTNLNALGEYDNNSMCKDMFKDCTSLKSLYFPALKSMTPYAFQNMITNCSNVTLHFPSNKQSMIESAYGYPNFGGTNTTIEFDLPAVA